MFFLVDCFVVLSVLLFFWIAFGIEVWTDVITGDGLEILDIDALPMLEMIAPLSWPIAQKNIPPSFIVFA